MRRTTPELGMAADCTERGTARREGGGGAGHATLGPAAIGAARAEEDLTVAVRAGPTPRRRWYRRWVNWRRVSSRAVLLVAFLAGIAALALSVIPFNVNLAEPIGGASVLRCGPPLFEVIVPADPE